ncbi:MAG: uncharacterized protein H6Q65_1160 [Firmicutes bacterium]|nr:uncharacterized protein [Bacillota bacterium]
MLINFTLKNWMSFKEEASFSMVASRERQHGERLAKVKKYKMRVLPIAVLYGGNASGKTNFFKALNFVRKFVVSGTKPDSAILTEPFKLDNESSKEPTSFSFELLVNEDQEENIYEFSFSVTRKSVIEEKLVLISSTNERTLYHRKDGKPNFDEKLEKEQFLQYAFQGTRDNQLFLTNAVSQKDKRFISIYNWFKNKLIMIAPDTRFGGFDFFDENDKLYNQMNNIIPNLDTGIESIGMEAVSFNKIDLPEDLKEQIREDIKEGEQAIVMAEPDDERIIVNMKGGEITAQKLIAYHQKIDGENIKFDMKEESDGSRRVINLLPAFLSMTEKNAGSIFVIDELDRSLHTLLTRQLIQSFLDSCLPESRAQLLFTTHDALLMDQEIFRRDEMWITERRNNASFIRSFSEYKDVRYDKDIRKSYLEGRLGGTPRIQLDGKFIKSYCARERGEHD